MIELRAEVSDWAEHVAQSLAEARLADGDVAGTLYAATVDDQLAYEVLVALSRTVALVLRPAGHTGGPIGPCSSSHEIAAARLVGSAARGDFEMVDALARTVLAPALAGDNRSPLSEARTTLWAILEVLASEPQLSDPQEGSPS